MLSAAPGPMGQHRTGRVGHRVGSRLRTTLLRTAPAKDVPGGGTSPIARGAHNAIRPGVSDTRAIWVTGVSPCRGRATSVAGLVLAGQVKVVSAEL